MLESALTVLLAWTLAAQQGLCGKLEKVAQQPNNVLIDYYAYRHISIVHFNVPELSVAIAFKYVSDPTGNSNELFGILHFKMQSKRISSQIIF